MVKERNEHFVLYASVFNTFDLLCEQVGKEAACDYIRAIMEYGFDGVIPPRKNPAWLYGFEKDKISIDNAQARYEKSQVNGAKGGRKKAKIDMERLCQLKETTKMTWDEIANEFPPYSKRTLQRRYSDYIEQNGGCGDEVLNFDDDKNATNATEPQYKTRQTENSFVTESDKTTKRQRQNDKTTKPRQYLSISKSTSTSMSNSIIFPPDGGNVVPSDKIASPLILSDSNDKTLEQENVTQCDKTTELDEKSATITTEFPTILDGATINEKNIYEILNTYPHNHNVLNQIATARIRGKLSENWLIDEDEQENPRVVNTQTNQSWSFAEEA